MSSDVGMTEPRDLDDPALRDRAVAAALGAAPFDVLLRGGRVVDVATCTIREADIGLVGGLIASVHAPGARGEAAETHDLAGALVAPGLIDTHLHVESSMITPRRYAEVVVPQGTTTICWDPHEVGNVAGLDGVRWAIDASRGLPLRSLVLAPSSVPSAPGLEMAGAEFGADAIRAMLDWPEVAGVAEVMDMRGVLGRSPRMRGIVEAGMRSGKLVCGHARDLEGADLLAFAAAGIESDHEITSGEDLLRKLEAGFTVELRASHEDVLPGVVSALRGLPVIPQTLTLCTDDILPDMLVREGGIVMLLRRLVALGLDPIQALRAATLNAAMRLGRRDLGLVAPGRRADLVVLSDLEGFEPREVFASGRLVARGGALIRPLRSDPVPAPVDTMRLAPIADEAFRLRVPGAASGMDGTATLRVVDRPRFTRWAERDAAVKDGEVRLPDDLILMAVAHRHGLSSPEPVLGVLGGWGRWKGAIATTISHDSHNLTVFGRDARDMAAAANALIAAGGGMAVAQDGVLQAVLPLSVCGLLSEAPAGEVASGLAGVREAADRVADFTVPPLMFRATVGASLACNPGPHVTDLGIADGTTGEVFAHSVAGFRPAGGS
ncbi:adenine deaminase [Rhizosaccharibacter radicis]|uniref:Adenine deaminase n=1 Tax=Rhizosaccharibacter radicis TaxID=2782605 RepID=A0ABT1W2S6_9PROT|nr:amidohydrolase family protein [Acetobacteraceae bacterium KSS12]